MKTEKIVKNINTKFDNVSRDFSHPKKKISKTALYLIALVVVILGVSTGYLLSGGKGLTQEEIKRDVSEGEIEVGITVGVADEKSFKDSAEGTLEKGGVDGEGSHHLVRPGGESQYVYLTSSIVDLNKFTGREVKVWGETFAAQKAGWLMDVGKLKVIK